MIYHFDMKKIAEIVACLSFSVLCVVLTVLAADMWQGAHAGDPVIIQVRNLNEAFDVQGRRLSADHEYVLQPMTDEVLMVVFDDPVPLEDIMDRY